MGRQIRQFYCFISDNTGNYYSASYTSAGIPVISKSPSPVPLVYNPSNLNGLKLEFATNKEYFSTLIGTSYPTKFVKDGADILRYIDYNQQGYESVAYFTIIKYNSTRGVYEKYLYAKFDFNKSIDDPHGTYTVNAIDWNAWTLISMNDSVQYQIDCSATNPKAIQVLFDGITLQARYTFQPVYSPIDLTGYGGYLVVPLVMVNQDGDSSGVLAQDEELNFSTTYPQTFMQDFPTVFCYLTQYASTLTITGTFTYLNNQSRSVGYKLIWYYWRSTDNYASVNALLLAEPNRILSQFDNENGYANNLEQSFDINQVFNLAAGESIMMGCMIVNLQGGEMNLKITPIVTNIDYVTDTVTQPTTVYALRPLDLLQEIVNRATNNQFSINSNYYTTNKNVVLTCGNALRQSPNAYIQSSFSDWFKSFDAGDFIAMRMIEGTLWIEPANTVYSEGIQLFDLGEIEDLTIEQASEYFVNEVEVGSPIQDYRRSSGRLEFNTTETFSLPVATVKGTLNLVSVYRRDGYGAEFIRLDYQGGSTADNKGDNAVFMIAITDDLGSSTTQIENFITITVDDAPLAPIITYPADNDSVWNDKPIIRGLSPQAQGAIKIYVDSVLDGSTTADTNGNWNYQLTISLTPYVLDGYTVITTGQHRIDATYTDETGTLNTVNLQVFSTPAPSAIQYPANNASLYNNLPIIRGIAPSGTVITITLDGNVIGTTTTDTSCKWTFAITNPISNTNHTIEATGCTPVNFLVNSFTAVPIITSFFDGFTVINNLPLVQGVGMPGTTVTLYLNYFAALSVGTANINAYGNWSIQLVTLTQPGTALPLTPIPNGTAVLSTALTNQVAYLTDEAFKLLRPAYNPITGVLDNTVFNTTLSPKRMMLARASYFAFILYQLQQYSIVFQTGDKNEALSTTLLTEDSYVNGEPFPQATYTAPTGIGNYIYQINGLTVTQYNTNFPVPGVIANYNLVEGVVLTVNRVSFLVLNVQVTTIIENANIPIASLLPPIALPRIASFTTRIKSTYAQILQDFSQGGFITGTLRGNQLFFKPIGTMTIDDITNNVQNWKLLLSPQTETLTLLNLSKNGLIIQLMNNAIYHSDYNSLHFVSYNLSTPSKYTFQELYDNWYNNRNDAWVVNPQYIQKFQTTELIRDQIITNNVPNSITLQMYKCSDASLVDTFTYTPVSPAPIPYPDVVQEVVIDFSLYPTDQYFFVLVTAGNMVAISERIETRTKWGTSNGLTTILLECTNSTNLTGAMYSTGFSTILRIEGLVQKWSPDIDFIVNEDEIGDNALLYMVNQRKRVILLGSAEGLPDYLYLKVAAALQLDTVLIEGVQYVLDKSNKMEENDRILGYPAYRYSVIMELANNVAGATFPAGEDGIVGGAILVVDAGAFGITGGGVLNIDVPNP